MQFLCAKVAVYALGIIINCVKAKYDYDFILK